MQYHAVGLVWGREWSIDATTVAADAALDSLQPRFVVEGHLVHLFARPVAGVADNDAAIELATHGAGVEPMQLGAERFREVPDRPTRVHDWLAAACRHLNHGFRLRSCHQRALYVGDAYLGEDAAPECWYAA